MKFILQENKEEFEFKSDKKNFDIRFNRNRKSWTKLMKKILTISLIFSLIVITSFIKNSTKKIDEELFSLKENISDLNLELDNVKLEFDYLSSPEKLTSYQNLYFENKFIQKSINEIKIIEFTREKILTNDVKIIDSEK